MAGPIPVADGISIDPSELEEQFMRAPGPGGQNVNKVETAVQLRFDVRHSPSLPNWMSIRAQAIAGRKLTKDGVIVITAHNHRTREQNREEALKRLIAILEDAARRPARRRPTRPSKTSVEKRVKAKTQRGAVKALRKVRLDD
jgi:ribosome-associated protein